MNHQIDTILLDLDDTLFDETNFIDSGFRHISIFLGNEFNINPKNIFEILKNDYGNGIRNNNFDVLINELNLNIDVNIIINEFYSHPPNVKLFDDSMIFLNSIQNKYKIGLITNGNPKTQNNKIDALQIRNRFDIILISGDYPTNWKKPNFRIFKEALRNLNSDSSNSIYIGDNPIEDMKGANDAGIRNVLLRRKSGIHRNDKIVSQPILIVSNLIEVLDYLHEN